MCRREASGVKNCKLLAVTAVSLALLLGGVSCAAWRLQKRLGWITLEKDQMDSL